MRTASLAKYHPKLQGIFGPLTKRQDEYLRRALDRADQELRRIASRIGSTTGLEMQWAESGQLFIAGHVTAGDAESHAATFMVTLSPSWAHEEPTSESEWVIDTSIDVDCQHVIDHESMENVFSAQERRQTPETAVDVVLASTRRLASLALDNPIEYWTSKAKS